MGMLKNNAIWIICILSFFAALFYNQLNLNHLPKNNIRDGETIITADDPSYIRPAHNYIETGKWKDNSIGKQSYFIRPPGYGLFYFTFLKVFDYPLALKFLKLAQLLLFSFSIFWLYYIACSLINNQKIALIISCFYGLSPFAIGFLFYSLTEGITPALLLLFVFLLFKAHQNIIIKRKNIFYFLAALCFAYLLIVRPALGFFGILLPIFLVKDFWKNGTLNLLLKLILFGVIAFSFTTIWQIRNYKITNQYVGLHPIYYADGNSIYRAPLKEYWNFVGGWAQEGNVAYSYMVPMWQSAIKGDTSIVYINNALKTFPEEVTTFYGKERLTSVFRKYQNAVLFQKTYYDKNLPMPEENLAIELDVVNEFKQLTSEYKSKFWFQYYILSPFKVFKTMSFHSNLSLYIFQNTYRGNILIETVRLGFFALHSMCFIMLLVSLLLIRNIDWRQQALTFSLFIYVFYLCYFQRGIEERYTLPIISFLLIGLISTLKQIYTLLRSKS